MNHSVGVIQHLAENVSETCDKATIHDENTANIREIRRLAKDVVSNILKIFLETAFNGRTVNITVIGAWKCRCYSNSLQGTNPSTDRIEKHNSYTPRPRLPAPRPPQVMLQRII